MTKRVQRQVNVLDPDRPLSLVLGAGGVRGLAHIGVLEEALSRGFRISEIVGTSVGALVAAFYAAVGMDVAELRAVGLGITTRRLLAWSWLRRAPDAVSKRFARRAGPIPDAIARLHTATWATMHHGVERIGLLAFDVEGRAGVVGHNAQGDLSVEDAARGAAALPWLFPPWPCRVASRRMRLADGGLVERLPISMLLEAPFAPAQILAVDVSNRARIREQNIARVHRIRERLPEVPIALALPETLGAATVVFRAARCQALVEAGRKAAAAIFDREALRTRGQSEAEWRASSVDGSDT